MREHRIRRLPVLDRAKQLVGMLTLNDIARAGAARDWTGDGLSAYEVGETLATVSRPAPVARTAARRP